MAWLFGDGFSHYATADAPKKWTSVLGTGTIGSTAGFVRRSGCSYFSLNGNTELKKTLGVNAGTLIYGCAYNFQTIPATNKALCYFNDSGTNQVCIAVNSALQVYALRGTLGAGTVLGTSSAALPSTGWFYLEVKVVVHATAGSVTVKLNGLTTLLNLTGLNTKATANAYANEFAQGNNASSSATVLVTDLYLCDSSGTENNNFLGDIRIDVEFPNGDGSHSDFTPSTGTSHSALVDEATPNTTDYVSSSTVGAKDTYQFQNLTTITGNILAVQVINAVMKDDAGSRSVANVVKSGATEVTDSAVVLSTSQTYSISVHEHDPATSAAWTESGVNNAEFGVTVAA